jgi:N6-adenosine-specific RNA methylase IME4
LNIDDEIKALLQPLSAEEKAQLEENILENGCRDPLVTWNGILIDGHNRYEICTRNGIEYRTVAVELTDREAVIDWVERNQLGRRNLTPDWFRYLLGRLYNRTKKANGERGPEKLDHFDLAFSTAARLAKEHAVSEPTVKRAAKFSEQVDADPVLKQALIDRVPVTRAIQESKKKATIEKLEQIASIHVDAPTKEYDVIVVDPPWPMKKIDRDVAPNQVEFDYPTMTEEELKLLEIPAAEDAHLWLWTTHKFLPMALRLMNHWGFKYICTFVWHKPGGFQPFNLPQYNCEFAVYGHRGNPVFVETKAFSTCFNAPRKEHSAKPEEFYTMVRRVTAGRRIDMFGRRKIIGFDTWGNEV